MLLTFDEEGAVRIKSDLANNSGEFFDQTLPYRIDSNLGMELVFETFGVFHYLFEIDANTFGAEFEFVYKGKEGGNLIFESKTDEINPTVLTFEPASANDENLLSRQLSENIEAFALTMPDMLAPESWLLWLGTLFILSVYFFPDGIVGRLRNRG